MPIHVRAVPREEFEAWATDARRRFASTMPPAAAPQVANAPTDPTLLADARR